jgi:predicted transcriptional regulator of viral defense system
MPTNNKTLAAYIGVLGQPVFTARELSAVSGRSASVVSQGLAFLEKQGLAVKVAHGVWASGGSMPSPYAVIPFILPRQRGYVSFTSALHLHGIIEQIPQVIALASVAHTREIHTGAGNYMVHHLAASFFTGFGWHKEGGFLIAEPEKALVDCLYVSAFRNRQYSYFPELDFSGAFSFTKAAAWAELIKNRAALKHVLKRLAAIKKTAGRRDLKKG